MARHRRDTGVIEETHLRAVRPPISSNKTPATQTPTNSKAGKQMSLQGKNIVITGATSGLGLDLARKFRSEGANVLIGGRREELGQRLASSIGASFHVLDAGDEASSSAFFQAAAKLGPLDAVLLNAGFGLPTAIEAIQLEDYDRIFNVNVRGYVLGIKHSIPLLRKGASLILTSSVASFLPLPTMPVYAASKAAVDGLVHSFAAQLASSPDERLRSLTIQTINPGPFTTEMAAKIPEDQKAIISQFSINKRFGEPEELSLIVEQLLTGKLNYQSGQSIVIDGPVHLTQAEYLARIFPAKKEE